MYRFILMLALAAAALPMQAAAQGTAERLYVMECGQGAVPDLRAGRLASTWASRPNTSPTAISSGTPRAGSCGRPAPATISSTVPEGRGRLHALAAQAHARSQLAEIGVKPDDVNFIAASHTHFDHIGNVNLFPKSVLLAQKAEYQWPLPKGGPRFNPAHPVTQIEGDHDVFGDGSAVLLATPGHTPGHQSFLLRLQEHRPDSVHRRRRAFPRELGIPARAVVQHQSGSIARLDGADRRDPGEHQGAALDPP